MLKNSMRKILLTACLSVFAVASTVGVLLSPTVQGVSASAAETWKTAKFEMEDGVSLKLGADKNGLRFIVSMDETVYSFLKANDEAKLGIVISTKWHMDSANGDYLNLAKKIGGELAKNKLYKEGNSYLANACITNIQMENFEYDFTAVAYVEYNGEVRYTEYNTLARNNLYDTVNMAVLNGYADAVLGSDVYTKNSEDGNGWYGTEQYPIVVENTNEYDALVEIAKTKDLSFYHLSVEDNATSSKDFAANGHKPTLISEAKKVTDLIEKLPQSIAMPEGVTLIPAIHEAEKAYNALSEADKEKVTGYAKLTGLLSAIAGYDRMYKNDSTDGTVIPSYVPGGYSSASGGAAGTRTDSLYGNVLRVQSGADGRAALYFNNFSFATQYKKIYFYVRVLDVSCDIYLSDGITNDGWGENWKNTWSTSGYWCNANTWRLIEVDVEKDGYIGKEFALGFRTSETGIAFEISDFYGYGAGERQSADLSFGTLTATGETNEYGTVYNVSQETWFAENGPTNTLASLKQSKLANALPSGYENFYFWMYNGTGTAYNFHLAGNTNSGWTDSKDFTTLKVGEWTKVVISAEDIALNKQGEWYVYLLGGDGQGGAKSGWKISTIYAGPNSSWVYTDYADVKNTIAWIEAIPETITLDAKAAIEKAAKAYDGLTETQKLLIPNAQKLATAREALVEFVAVEEVINLINSIDGNDIDSALVTAAREAYNALSDSQKAKVTNLAKLEAYEKEIAGVVAVQKVQALINALPDSVVMPDNLVFVPRIEAAKAAYDLLSIEGKLSVNNYGKLSNLLQSIKGYTTVYRQTVEGVNVIPSYVPNYTSSIGGSATLGSDSYYGNYLKVTSDVNGIAAIQFKNFPDVSQYTKIYFNIRVVGDSCVVYLSDGITNDGWGDGWNNNWSIDGYWANNGNWIQKEVAVSTEILSSNWALGLRTKVAGVSFEITDIIAWSPDLGTNSGLTFGNFNASGESNEYGSVYNFTQGWGSDTDMGAFNQGALQNALAEGHDKLHFWMYNPQSVDVNLNFTGEANAWDPKGEYVTTLRAKQWTEVVVTPTIIEQGNQHIWYVTVSSGAGVSGWKISPIYSYTDEVESVDSLIALQMRINDLDVHSIDEGEVNAIRAEYEQLSEADKSHLNIDNLTACEGALYGNVATASFITAGKTNYKIYYDGSSLTDTVNFVQTELQKATGATLPLVTDRPETITMYRYAIVFGYEDLAQTLGVECPTEAEYGASGYVVKRVGRVVFVVARSQDGYRMAMLEFLNQTIGYEMISEDCVVYGKDGATLPTFDGVETPSFAYRQVSSRTMTDAEVYAMGMHKHKEIWIPVEGYDENGTKVAMDMHNALYYLPKATYGSTYSSWYYTVKDSAGTTRTQICPTAGGNAAAYQAMLDVIQSVMIERINTYPTRENISFSIMDSAGGDACTCARCSLYNTLYGSAGFSAAWIDLMNDINANIQEYIRVNMPGRKLNVSFLAYRSTEGAPANDDLSLKQHYIINSNTDYYLEKDASGNPVYLQCDDGVAVWLAPINATYAENFNHADNADELATIKKWAKLSSNVYLWMYGTNFSNYMYPYNSWQASAENYKILSDLGNVTYVWNSNIDAEGTAFTDLKQYIDSVFMRNANANYEETLDTYFTNYFGAAAEPMREMFDKIVAKCNEIEANNKGLGRGIYDDVKNKKIINYVTKKYWSEEWLNELLACVDEAYAAVGDNQVLRNRILKESLFPRYVLYRDYQTASANREQFEKDCTDLNVTHYRETGTISDDNLWKY